jgi:hypothetical protein
MRYVVIRSLENAVAYRASRVITAIAKQADCRQPCALLVGLDREGVTVGTEVAK